MISSVAATAAPVANLGQARASSREAGAAASAPVDTDGAGARTKEARANGLSDSDQAVVAKLKATDREVRAHEQAHLAAAGGLARGGATYTYQRGPDGQLYAVGGEVSIDVSPGRTPEETLQRAQQVRAAALAPASPSSQDRAVAAQAAQLALDAQLELARQNSGQQRAGQATSASHDFSTDSALALYRANEDRSVEQASHLIDIFV